MRERLGPLTRAALGARIWWWYLRSALRVRNRPLPDVLDWIAGTANTRRAVRMEATRLGTIVGRVLLAAPHTNRCLLGSLVLYRLLRERGESPELVIGLRERPSSPDAHAWIELGGIDVGPPPGRSGHSPLARYR